MEAEPPDSIVEWKCPNCGRVQDWYNAICIACYLPHQEVDACKEPVPSPSPMPAARATMDRALSLIGGDRLQSYGSFTEEASHVAKAWNSILKGREVEPRLVPLMMAALKLVREASSHKQDNIDDAVGYLGLAAELEATPVNSPPKSEPEPEPPVNLEPLDP